MVFLEQGDLHAALHPTIITTILGSCISVCLWDPVLRIGGMNHFALACGGGAEPRLRYGDAAVAALVDAMTALGASPHRLVAKVFGGGAVLPVAKPHSSIGAQNARIAAGELRRHRIPIVALSTGGHQGLVIRMHTYGGDVFVRRLDTVPDVPPKSYHPSGASS